MKYTNNVFKEKKKNCVNIEVTHNISKLMIVNKYLVYNLVVFAQMAEVGPYPESLVETWALLFNNNCENLMTILS